MTRKGKGRALDAVAEWVEELLDEGNDPASVASYVAEEIRCHAKATVEFTVELAKTAQVRGAPEGAPKERRGMASTGVRFTYYRAEIHWPTSPGVFDTDAREFPTHEDAQVWLGAYMNVRRHALGQVTEHTRIVDLDVSA